jgi:hypothetical protein
MDSRRLDDCRRIIGPLIAQIQYHYAKDIMELSEDITTFFVRLGMIVSLYSIAPVAYGLERKFAHG